jgi:hypothetical protein
MGRRKTSHLQEFCKIDLAFTKLWTQLEFFSGPTSQSGRSFLSRLFFARGGNVPLVTGAPPIGLHHRSCFESLPIAASGPCRQGRCAHQQESARQPAIPGPCRRRSFQQPWTTDRKSPRFVRYSSSISHSLSSISHP